jgi:16S rRNA (cytosine967-C5)-methyltransferase
VIESLSWIELRRINEDAAIRRTVKQLNIYEKKIVETAKELVYETIRRQNSIDFIIKEVLEPRNFRELKIGLRSFLRLYTYLVHYSIDSLLQANELVEYVNRVFRKKDLKQIKSIPDLIPTISIPFKELPNTTNLAYSYFHPIWYISYLIENFGEKKTIEIIKSIEYPSYFRVNTLNKNLTLVNSLMKRGYKLLPEPKLANTYRYFDDNDITITETYKKGYFIKQDKASILVGFIANPKPEDTVLDVCAAPGMKTSHLAQIMENNGRIFSIDSNKRRMKSWQILMKRLGVTNAEPIIADASKPFTLNGEKVDLLLVDPPCTGTGLFHKSPSSKWRLTPRSIDTMAKLQKKIIINSCKHLKEGGTLVYSTCSITIEENEGVIKSILEEFPSFKPVESSPRIGDQGLMGLSEAQRFFPHKHGCNGFFIIKLLKGIRK